MAGAADKTFYLETFGCQMNVHDSEKVIGTLVQQGYRQVATVDEAGLILYNTCSIRDKAEQKVFNRLNDFKKLRKQGKKFGVLGCVAQQEGERIFEKAPHVDLVCGSASYRNLPQMLLQIENAAKTGDRASASPGLTIARPISALRPNTRRAPILIADISPSSRAATSSALIALFPLRAAKSAAGLRIPCWRRRGNWSTWDIGDSTARAKRELLSRSRWKEDLCGISGGAWRTRRHPAGSFYYLAPARLWARHRRGDRRGAHALRPRAFAGAERLDAGARCHAAALYAGGISGAHRLDSGGQKRDISITTDIIVGFPGETERDFEETLSLLELVGYDSAFTFKYSPRPNTPALRLDDAIPDEEKARRLAVVNEKQRQISAHRNKRHLDRSSRSWWKGRTRRADSGSGGLRRSR